MRNRGTVCFSILIFVAACGQAVSTSPTPTTTSPTASRPSPSPPVAQPYNLTCRLPVVAQTQGGVERGWITSPGGQYLRDDGAVANFSDGTVANYYSTEHMPSYDWGVGVWVPAEQEYVSPDGSDYVVQIDSRSKLPTGFYLVDAKTGSKRLIQSAQGPSRGISWTLLAYQHEGIYLGALGAAGDAPTEVPGLWLLDPGTGSVRLIDQSHIWNEIGGGVAWAVDAPPNAIGTWTVYWLDLTTGRVNKSYASDDFGGFVAPTPEGDVLVRGRANGGAERIFRLTTTDQLLPIALPIDFGLDYGGQVAEPGVWMPFATGVALYTKASGLQVMAQSPYGLILFPAAGCR
jgi:hypothetical protein